jgi:chorismate synthase
MSTNSIGTRFVLTCFGESHGQCVGAVVDGCPPGISLSVQDVQIEVDKRRSISEQVSTPRKEVDKVEILSGIFNGYTTGAPICMLVWNRNINSRSYDELRWKPRPGHADFPAIIRYRKFNDYRGGGRFSGRITLAIVMAGAIAKKILDTFNSEVLSHSVEIGGIKLREEPSIDEIRNNTYRNVMRCADPVTAQIMHKAVSDVRDEGDSVGGIVECIVLAFPPGIGDPIFDSLDADLAKILFAIPAVKGVEFGAGFNASRLKGSENNDQYTLQEDKIGTLTNNAGGILGGLSNGMPIIIRVGFKPTPSISKKQQTVDLRTQLETTLEIQGRHDACIVPRAVPVVEAATAIVLADHLLRRHYDVLRVTTDE